MDSKAKEKLKGYSVVKPNQIQSIKPGDRVRYMVDGEFRGGGGVKVNKYPDYIVLINLMNNVSWCMQLKNPTLKMWVKPLEKIQKERSEKEAVYQLYKQGKLTKK